MPEDLSIAVRDGVLSPRPLPPPQRIQELLFDAARLGRIDVILPLIKAGADLGAVNPAGHTPLILACYNGQEASANFLIELGAQVDQPDAVRGNTALMGAAFKGLTSIAECLLEAGAEPEATSRSGQTALMFAALFARVELVDMLLARGADPDRCDAAGNSALSMAMSQGNAAVIDRLSRGRDGLSKGRDGRRETVAETAIMADLACNHSITESSPDLSLAQSVGKSGFQ